MGTSKYSDSGDWQDASRSSVNESVEDRVDSLSSEKPGYGPFSSRGCFPMSKRGCTKIWVRSQKRITHRDVDAKPDDIGSRLGPFVMFEAIQPGETFTNKAVHSLCINAPHRVDSENLKFFTTDARE